MGQIKKNPPVKLIIGFIFKEAKSLEGAEAVLSRRFGEIDFSSRAMPFIHTDYYEKEFGHGLSRAFVSFKKLILPEDLAEIKTFTNKAELKFSAGASRLINIDPGYLDQAKLVLASTKDFKHRIYLKKGIFAEITLFYAEKTFQPWEWTYPDYKTPEYITIFNQIRDIYARQIK